MLPLTYRQDTKTFGTGHTRVLWFYKSPALTASTGKQRPAKCAHGRLGDTVSKHF